MSVIRLTVDGQKLMPVEKPLIASQGVVEDSVVFDFSDEWDGYGKVALFWRAEDEAREDIYQVMVDENSTALVPWEVTQTDGEICITVFGTKDTSVITAEIITYKVVEGLYSEGQGSEPPTPDIYQQILAIAGEVNGKFETAIDDIAVIDARVDNIVAQQTSGMLSGNVINIVDINNVTLNGSGRANIELDGETYPWIMNANMKILSVEGFYETYNISDPSELISSSTVFSSGECRIQYIKTSPLYEANTMYVSFVYDDWANKEITVRLVIMLPYTQDLSELTDIRVGVDSTTYTSAGAAVRAQINHLQDEIDELGS